MVNKESVQRALDARLSALSASPQRRARIRAAAFAKEETETRRKFAAGLIFALAALLALTGAALAVKTNLFARFAVRDARYEAVLDQTADVTEAPAIVRDERLGETRAYVDSAYYDGRSLTLTFALENRRSAEEWEPAPEEKARMEENTDGNFPLFADEAPAAEEIRLEEAYLKAREEGKPFGYRTDSVWVHDTFYTDDGVELPPYSGDTIIGDNGEIYEVREFTPLPEAAAGRDILSVYAELGRSTVYYYFDGVKEYWMVDVQRENVGRITATVPRNGAETLEFSGTGTLCGAECTVTAKVSAMDLYLTIAADADVFPGVRHQIQDGGEWIEQPWMAAVYDETGREYMPRESAGFSDERTLEIPYDGTGQLPQRLTVRLYRSGMDDAAPTHWSETLELTR